MVVAGDYLHLYKYQQSNAYGYTKPKREKRLPNTNEEKTQSHLHRTKKQVRLLLQSNLNIHSHYRLQFVTYTFRKEITNLADANKLYKDFTLRLNYHLKTKLKYLLVPEIQPERAKKYGAKVWHFHVIYFNLPQIYYPKLYKIWGHGGIRVKPMNDPDHLVNYVAKYFTKQDDHDKNKKRFVTSRGLQRPWEFRDEQVITEFKKNLDEVGKPTFEKTYNAKTWDGQENETTYSIYKLTETQKALLQSLKSVL